MKKNGAVDLVSGARKDDVKRIAFLEQHGFQYCGDFAEINMIRSVDEPILIQKYRMVFKSENFREPVKSQIAQQSSAKCGIPGRSEMSETMINSTLCKCQVIIATWTCTVALMALSLPM